MPRYGTYTDSGGTIDGDEIILAVDDPGGTPETKRWTLGQLRAGLQASTPLSGNGGAAIVGADDSLMVNLDGGTVQALLADADALLGGAPRSALSLGLVGDGTTDDAPALQAAIDAGHSIYFPPDHIYLIGDTIEMKSGMQLLGPGGWGYVQAGQPSVPSNRRSILKLDDGVDAPMFHSASEVGWGHMAGLDLDGNKDNQTTPAALIEFEDGADPEEAGFIFDRMYIHGANGQLILVGAYRQNVQVLNSFVIDATLNAIEVNGTDFTAFNSYIGVSVQDGLKVTADVARITNCELFSCEGSGLTIAANRVVVTGTTVDRNEGHGIYVDLAREGVAIIGCTLHTNNLASPEGFRNHLTVKEDAKVALIGTTFAPNDVVGNLAWYAISIETDAEVRGVGVLTYGTVAQNVGSDPLGLTDQPTQLILPDVS